MVKDLFWSVQCEHPRRNFWNQCSLWVSITLVVTLKKHTYLKNSLQMSQFHKSCIFLSLCNKIRNSYCKQVTGINCFKNEKHNFSLMSFIYLEFISCETRSQLLKNRTEGKWGFNTRQWKKQNPGAIRGHRILTDQIA